MTSSLEYPVILQKESLTSRMQALASVMAMPSAVL
jgi:hypothetical protein